MEDQMNHAQKWVPISPGLRRVQARARAHPLEQFTSLAHHLDEALLLQAYRRLKPGAAPGIDGETKTSYGMGLRSRLSDLHARLRTGRYRARPIRRKWLEKPDGGARPIGILTVEDKIVQGAVVEILNSIYETSFYGFSYGFRPGRNAHQALQALQTVLQKGQVNWVLDLDLAQCFDSITHEALQAGLQRRVKDRQLLRLIRKWLTVGTVEADGSRERQHRGTPQGAVISPVLANIVLHDALDEFIANWRRDAAHGEVYVVRYADDAVLAFEHENDARTLRQALIGHLAQFGLEVNEAKTRLVAFGQRPWRQGTSGTFEFLGFTHYAGASRTGSYLVQRKTARKRLRRSLRLVSDWCRANRHKPVRWQWSRLSMMLQGHYGYYGIRGNYRTLARFRARVWHLWLGALRRRSQKCNLARLVRLLQKSLVLPHPRITHSDDWLPVSPGHLLRRAGCGNSARPVL
ncbi:MAG: group II intron reverse transcriptase/maturase [Planctomycetota bacterium]|jgi:group II intron reverse transcriptase/maturase